MCVLYVICICYFIRNDKPSENWCSVSKCQMKHLAGRQMLHSMFSKIFVHERVFLSGAENLYVLVNEDFFLPINKQN